MIHFLQGASGASLKATGPVGPQQYPQLGMALAPEPAGGQTPLSTASASAAPSAPASASPTAPHVVTALALQLTSLQFLTRLSFYWTRYHLVQRRQGADSPSLQFQSRQGASSLLHSQFQNCQGVGSSSLWFQSHQGAGLPSLQFQSLRGAGCLLRCWFQSRQGVASPLSRVPFPGHQGAAPHIHVSSSRVARGRPLHTSQGSSPTPAAATAPRASWSSPTLLFLCWTLYVCFLSSCRSLSFTQFSSALVMLN